jgi:hypothetical protein
VVAFRQSQGVGDCRVGEVTCLFRHMHLFGQLRIDVASVGYGLRKLAVVDRRGCVVQDSTSRFVLVVLQHEALDHRSVHDWSGDQHSRQRMDRGRGHPYCDAMNPARRQVVDYGASSGESLHRSVAEAHACSWNEAVVIHIVAGEHTALDLDGGIFWSDFCGEESRRDGEASPYESSRNRDCRQQLCSPHRDELRDRGVGEDATLVRLEVGRVRMPIIAV